MKKLIKAILFTNLIIILFIGSSFAQFRGGFSFGGGMPPSVITEIYNTGFGLQVDFRYLIENRYDVGLSGAAYYYIGKSIGNSSFDGTGVVPIILSGDYIFFPDKGIRPFAGLGLGSYTNIQFLEGGSLQTRNFGVSLAGGALFKLGNKTDLNLGFRFHPSNNIHRVSFNLGFLFGKRNQE